MDTGNFVNQNIFQYEEDAVFRAKWDFLQRRVRCCGGRRWEDLSNVRIGRNAVNFADHENLKEQCVPDSCCITPNCRDTIRGKDGTRCAAAEILMKNIYSEGCLSTLERLYESDLKGLMVVYSVVGIFLGMAELAAVALAFAYAAQISRRRKREWSPGEDVTRGHNASSSGAVANDNINMDDFDN